VKKLYRSHLTRLWPRFDGSERSKRVKDRQLIVGLVLVCTVVLFAALFFFRRTWLYGVHDYVWLPIKGTVYTWCHPWSLIWCVYAILLYLFLMTSFLLSRSFLRRIHLRVIHMFLESSGMTSLMMSWSRFVMIFGVVPRMSLLALNRKRKRLIARLLGNPIQKPLMRRCKKLVELTRMGMVWMRMCSKGKEGNVQALLLWRETLMLLQSFRPNVAADKRAKLSGLQAEMVAEGLDDFLSLLGCAASQLAVADDNAFSEPVLAYEWLLLLADDGLAVKLGASDQKRATQLFEERMLKQLPLRRNDMAVRKTILQLNWDSAPSGLIAAFQLPQKQAALWGRFAMDLVLSFSEMRGDPSFAQAWFKTVEALDLLLSLDEKSDPEARTFIQDMLTPDNYRRLAALEAVFMNIRFKQWHRSSLVTEEVLGTPDLAWIQTRTSNLLEAAGPEMRPLLQFKDGPHE